MCPEELDKLNGRELAESFVLEVKMVLESLLFGSSACLTVLEVWSEISEGPLRQAQGVLVSTLHCKLESSGFNGQAWLTHLTTLCLHS